MTRPPVPSRCFLLTAAVLLVLLHAVLALTAMAEKSMTADEIAHLTAGQAYNTRNDYRLQPENGNLPQRLAALPMTLARVPLPPASSKTWQTADVWNYGHAFFYEDGILADEWLFLGRAMIALVSAATGLLVFTWSRALWGWRGAFLSLVLFAFSPTFLAHGALATSDVVMTFCFLASVGAWWRHLERPGIGGAAISAGALGFAFVSKFSAPLLLPILGLCGVAWTAGEALHTGWRAPVLRLLRTAAVHAIVTWVIIWAFYGFRFSAFAPEFSVNATFNHGWGWLLNGLGYPARIIWWLNRWRVLPEAWLYGLTFVLQFSRARGAFMSGEYSLTGWVSFFPWAFTIKTTVPLLLITLITTIAGVRTLARQRLGTALGCLRPFAPLVALFVVYWAISVTSHLNIGHRHILPIYPVLFICAGWLGPRLDLRQPLTSMSIAALALWHVSESLIARPHYLAYFNEIVGGSRNGWRHLVDSSLDWGQDLPGLKRWLNQHASGEPVFLSYFGTGDPAYEGIRATLLPCLPELGRRHQWHRLTPGIYAISVTMLQHVYSPIRGPWTLELEKEYQELRELEPLFEAYTHDPKRRAELEHDAPANHWTKGMARHDQLRFARLCYYLRVRGPDARIGYSIHIYRLNASELHAAIDGTPQEWRMLIEQTVTNHAGS